jgi:CMP/dCMP kinase
MSKIITITGALGSGKSTIAGILCEKLGFERYSTGQAQRKIAEKYGITTLELNKRAEQDKSIDDEIDGVFKSLEENGRSYIIDSRMAWHFIPSSFKVKLEIDPVIAAQRVTKDSLRTNEDHATLEETLENLKKRRASEVERFQKYYHVDIEDRKNFNLVIDTSFKTPEEIVQIILDNFEKFQQKNLK